MRRLRFAKTPSSVAKATKTTPDTPKSPNQIFGKVLTCNGCKGAVLHAPFLETY
jgi:hypothetical protein